MATQTDMYKYHLHRLKKSISQSPGKRRKKNLGNSFSIISKLFSFTCYFDAAVEFGRKLNMCLSSELLSE